MAMTAVIIGRRTLKDIVSGKVIRKDNDIEMFDDYWTSDSDDPVFSDFYPSQAAHSHESPVGVPGTSKSPVSNKRSKHALRSKRKKARTKFVTEIAPNNRKKCNIVTATKTSGNNLDGTAMLTDSSMDEDTEVAQASQQCITEYIGSESDQSDASSDAILPIAEPKMSFSRMQASPNTQCHSKVAGADEMIVGNTKTSKSIKQSNPFQFLFSKSMSHPTNENTQVRMKNGLETEKLSSIRTDRIAQSCISKITKSVCYPEKSKISGTSAKVRKEPISSRKYQTRNVREGKRVEQIDSVKQLEVSAGGNSAEDMQYSATVNNAAERKLRTHGSVISTECELQEIQSSVGNEMDANVNDVGEFVAPKMGSASQYNCQTNHSGTVSKNAEYDKSPVEPSDEMSNNLTLCAYSNGDGHHDSFGGKVLEWSQMSTEGNTTLQNSSKSCTTKTSKTVLVPHEAETTARRCSPLRGAADVISTRKVTPKHTSRQSFVSHEISAAAEVIDPSLGNNGNSIKTAEVRNEVVRPTSKRRRKGKTTLTAGNVKKAGGSRCTLKKKSTIHSVTSETSEVCSKNKVNDEMLHGKYMGKSRMEVSVDSDSRSSTMEFVGYSTVDQTELHKRSKRNLKTSILPPVNNTETSEQESVLRRSTRLRFPPLEGWRNERTLFRINNGTYEFMGVDKGGKDHSEWNHTLLRKRAKKSVLSSPSALTVVDPETNEEVAVRLVRPYDSLSWRGQSDSSKESSPVLVSRSFQFEDYSCGLIKIKPLEHKPLQYSPEYDILFFVAFGHIKVRIHTTDIILHSKDTFIVPQGLPYSVSNISRCSALIHFSMLRKSYLSNLKISKQHPKL